MHPVVLLLLVFVVAAYPAVVWLRLRAGPPDGTPGWAAVIRWGIVDVVLLGVFVAVPLAQWPLPEATPMYQGAAIRTYLVGFVGLCAWAGIVLARGLASGRRALRREGPAGSGGRIVPALLTTWLAAVLAVVAVLALWSAVGTWGAWVAAGACADCVEAHANATERPTGRPEPLPRAGPLVWRAGGGAAMILVVKVLGVDRLRTEDPEDPCWWECRGVPLLFDPPR